MGPGNNSIPLVALLQHKNASNLPASFAWTGEVLQDEKPSGTYAIELMKMTDKMDKIHISGKFSNSRIKLMVFFHTCNFTVFPPRIQTDFSSLELRQLRLFGWTIR